VQAADDDFTLPGVVLTSSTSSTSSSTTTAPPSSPPPRPQTRGFPGDRGGRGRGGGDRGGNDDKDMPKMNDDLVRFGPKEVRLIIHGGDGGDEMMGVVPTVEAYEKAREMGE